MKEDNMDKKTPSKLSLNKETLRRLRTNVKAGADGDATDLAGTCACLSQACVTAACATNTCAVTYGSACYTRK
jgi:hypothetical protein